MKPLQILITLLLITAFVGCSKDSEDDLITPPNNGGQNDDPDPTAGNFQFSYDTDIAPIMSSSCVNCHASVPVNGAPFALVSYEQVRQRANGVLSAMDKQSGTPGAMPPVGRLPEATIDKVRQWIADGFPEN